MIWDFPEWEFFYVWYWNWIGLFQKRLIFGKTWRGARENCRYNNSGRHFRDKFSNRDRLWSFVFRFSGFFGLDPVTCLAPSYWLWLISDLVSLSNVVTGSWTISLIELYINQERCERQAISLITEIGKDQEVGYIKVEYRAFLSKVSTSTMVTFRCFSILIGRKKKALVKLCPILFLFIFRIVWFN